MMEWKIISLFSLFQINLNTGKIISELSGYRDATCFAWHTLFSTAMVNWFFSDFKANNF